ncbi:MAG: DUF1211 domain-containing protein [Chitinophagaceae bacterium]|nr:MAG: DUF1211 domain-containing protein [Chitinophagaceae bacterium]
MGKGRLEAFSDGVLAIIITIMVLELHVPHGAQLADLKPLLPVALGYILSFIYVGIYWNNHHHLLQAAQHTNGRVLWANAHLLFWLSLIPFTTAWMGEHPGAPAPVAIYGVVLFGAGLAYYILTLTLVHAHSRESVLARSIGRDGKGLLSVLLYALAIGGAFISVWISHFLYIVVAVIWFVPDRRIERRLGHDEPHS